MTTRLVAISGSLRAGSSNTALLQAAAAVTPAGATLHLSPWIGELPLFNPDLDLEGAAAPPAVQSFRAELAAAEGLVISTPEYAHGLPGALKNALDWVVSSGELGGKPVLLINASPGRGQWAQASLTETLSVMEARVLVEAEPRLPSARPHLEASGALTDPAFLGPLRASMAALVAAIASSRSG